MKLEDWKIGKILTVEIRQVRILPIEMDFWNLLCVFCL